ncbi:ABC-2 type transport system permease protein [Flavobacterium sp. CF108]|uniref:ABC transporter permease n=1 Tax=unclassified Flavobacterium TaxID=196869 RepID=UPI0008C44E52|nr:MULTISPECIES: ABC transporter permease [unclassified Flavobacterium]SEN90699.1 ABC-2 type transport system permease protein [Flavobacterium sp. fv08]SHH25376.1 ABC-2 type transport system permease protein [Flavobacterium sp. CF108]
MRIIKFLLIKEFKQIFRNRAILAVIMVMPVIQLIILPLAANYEIKNINLAVVDNDRSDYSRDLINQVIASGYFKLRAYNDSYKQAFTQLEEDNADLILEIPHGFEQDLIKENKQQLFIGVNAINGTKAGLGAGYISDIIREYNNGLRKKMNVPTSFNAMPVIEITSSNWYNPHLNYQLYMVPGILAILVTLVGGFLSALNIVKEKEAGTIEQINVSPVKKYHFILGKLIPFWILGNVVFTLGLLVGWIFYGIIPVGNLLVLYAFIAVYLLAILGFGLLVSTICDTQQQAMLIMFFFVMIFVLMGGLFTPIDSMPDWAKTVSKFNPISYFIDVMRMVVIKGSGFKDVQKHIIIMVGFAIVLNIAAVLNYRKTS